MFFDDILVYSPSMEEHWHHLEMVFGILEKNKLVVKKKKCSLEKSEVHYLGHIIYVGGVKADPMKIEAMKTWPQPKNVKEFTGILRANHILP